MMRRLVVLFSLFWFVAGQANAQAALVSRLGQEIAAVIKSKAIKRGFAANDPRYAGAVMGVGTAAAELGAAVVVAGTAPAWGAILASAVIAGAVGYGIQALANWVFNSDGTATYTPPQHPPTTYPAGTNFIKGDDGSGHYSWYPLDANNGSVDYCTGYWSSNHAYSIVSSSGYNCYLKYTDPAMASQYIAPQAMNGQISWGTPTDATPIYAPPSGPTQPVTKPVGDALAGLSDADKAKTLDPVVVAAIADAAWKKAASDPGYSGIPYSATDPVTAADVAAVRAANPAMQPSTVGDLAAPISVSDPLGEVAASPSGSTSPGINPAASNPLQNLGVDPGIGAPTLETTPTAQAILSPITSLMPSLKNFVVPSHQSVCPTPSMDLFGKHLVLDGQCTLLESSRPTLYAVMAVVWLVLALFIVLAA